jgi:YegS/Rv2252/BmrU family lipid kinase
MRRVALIHNPVSGRQFKTRSAVLREAIAVLNGAGIETELMEATSRGSAGLHAKDAVRRGFDTVLACGGDGTVHEILQCLVGTQVALGVVPFGTANALAQNLGLGASPVKAVHWLVDAVPTEIPIGRITYMDTDTAEERSSYFIVAAGIGLDALLMSRPDPELKRRFGYVMYVFEVIRIWLTHSFPLFCAEFTCVGSDEPQVEQVSQVLAVRIRSFGGLLGTLAPGASLHNGKLRLMAFKTRSRLRYFRFLMAVLAGRHSFEGEIELVKAISVECTSNQPIWVEADGEVLGVLPAKIEVSPQPLGLTLLIPRHAQP